MSLVLVEKRDTHVEVVLNRVDKHNALSMKMIEELTSLFKSLESDSKGDKWQSLVIRSASSKAFCAGADLTERISMSDDEVIVALDSLRSLMSAIEKFPLPTLAVLEGVAFGGGLEMALCCDLRFAGPNVEYGLTETMLAIIPGAGGTQRLARLLGAAKAKELIFTARRVKASCKDFALFSYVGDDALEQARAVATEISKTGPIALRAAKEAISYAQTLSIEEALDWERECYLKTLKTEDRHEALRAFSEKRSPNFKGK
ncbi:enoyl-CoA hydratase [bacterium]|nr:enoyl-CoA hydratase [bacterium]